MRRLWMIVAGLGLATQAHGADHDALDPLPVMPMLGRAYPGVGEPAAIRFVNMRDATVRVLWIDRAGLALPYRTLAPGEEYVQPTYVSHRWLIEDDATAAPVEGFIATRSTAGGHAETQIAIIR